MKRVFKIVLHFILILLLTVITQIGGFVYLLTILFIRSSRARSTSKRLFLFALLYTSLTFFVVPPLAAKLGRVPITENNSIKAHSIFYKIANRNYVTPVLNSVLQKTAIQFDKKYSGIQLIYLDANFPFANGFPLLPHLSHNDGKKIDITLLYEQDGKVSNAKTSRSGYGVYVTPFENEFDQTESCKQQGYWQYDFPKYLSLGATNEELIFSTRATAYLLQLLVEERNTQKIFIEKHLVQRMQLNYAKLRFQGCQAVRHDDHIHLQVY